MKRAMLTLLILMLAVAPAMAQDGAITLTPIATYETGVFDEGAAEILDYDAMNQRLVVVNSAVDGGQLDLLDISDPTSPELVSTIDMSGYGDGANSVAVSGETIAVAVEGPEVDATGVVVFLNLEGEELAVVTAGVLPDMVTFTPDGTKALVANEGEPSDDYSIDPEGSISIIDLSGGVENLTDDAVTTAGFGDFAMEDLPEGVRVFGPDATPAQDFEPEYIAISGDSSTAYVALQENNTLAVVDIEAGAVTALVPLGFKDYSLEENSIDASNEDGGINMNTWPVLSMYQPDAIATYEVDGETFIVTANEGDARDYDTFSEEARVADITLDPEVFPNAEELQAEDQLGRLLITTTLGNTDDDEEFEALYGYGARSFSIWNSAGELVYDSANEFEMITAEQAESFFNSNGAIDSFDQRSDDKGPEPEGVVVGEVNGVPYAFIGLERVGGIMVYDVSDPTAATFVTYVNNNNPEGNAEELTAGDVGPEGLKFISADVSPNGNPLLAVGNEVSGTTTIYEVTSN